MDDPFEQAARRAITAMQENLGEQLTVDDMARAAMFSKFHFTRVFQRVTGVSPGRFLSALRLQRAKHLLVSTSLNVADISVSVGYNSVGTFSSRFSRSVGMSPTTYRRRRGFATHILTETERPDLSCTGRVYGEIRSVGSGYQSRVFVGLFPERIPEGRPVRCTILDRPGAYRFDKVPAGSWYVLAQSTLDEPGRVPVSAQNTSTTGGTAWSRAMAASYDADLGATDQVSVAAHGPITVRGDATFRADLVLKPAGALDPPVLLALLDVRRTALAAAAAEG